MALFYGTALNRERTTLRETVDRAAAVIEGGGAETLALELLPGVADRGWAALVTADGQRREVVLSRGREGGLGPGPAGDPGWLEPAFAGETGTRIGRDATGKTVLGAYAPAGSGGLIVIAAVDLWHLRTPFVRSGIYTVVIAGLLIALGVFTFQTLGAPLMDRLHAGESRFRELFDTMRSGAMIVDLDDASGDFVIRAFNRAAERIDAVSADEVVGAYLSRVYPGLEDYGLPKVMRRVARTGEPERLPVRYYQNDRVCGWRDTYVFRLPGGEVVTLYDDVTEQKKAEQSVRDSEARWRSIIALQAEATMVVDAEDRIRFVNQAAEALFGTSSEQLIGEPFGFPIVAGDVAEIEILKPGGGVAYAEMQAIPMRWDGEDQFLLFIRDISAHRRAEGDLRKLFQAIEQSPVSVVITDVTGRIEYVNPKFTEATGYTYAEVVGKNPSILKSGLTPPETYQALWRTIAAGGVWSGELYNKKKSGELFWELASIAPVRDVRGKVTHYVAVKEDITERKANEERLRTAQKMKAVGELTGGIAHDFNNLLAIILGNLQLLDEELDPGDERHELIADAIWSVERGSELTNRLLAFARRQRLNPKNTNVNVVIGEMTDLLRRTLGDRIAIREILAEGLWMTMIDRGQLESAIVNLVVNARDAMPDGGVVTLATHNVIVDAAPDPDQTGPPPGQYVRIAVTDTGCGMSPDVVERIFEPFFTTKGFGKGSGLGLSMVYGFVTQSGGHIVVDSAPDAGTSMLIYLPQTEAEGESAEDPKSPAIPTVDADHAVILVVEDDERVRRTAVRVLQRNGYVVREAASAEEARRCLETMPELDLLFTDIVLREGVDGNALAREVLKSRPGARVLFTSGYPSSETAARLSDSGYPFLQKPYRREALLEKVHAILS